MSSSKKASNYRCAVRRLTILLVMPNLVEIVLIELSYKAGKVAVFKVFR